MNLHDHDPVPVAERCAFPAENGGYHLGMTYRQWLIGMAMQGFCSNKSTNDGSLASIAFCAGISEKQADAVIALLDKEQSK